MTPFLARYLVLTLFITHSSGSRLPPHNIPEKVHEIVDHPADPSTQPGAAPHGAVHDDPLRVAGSDARAFAVELKPKDGRLGPRYGMRSAHGVVLGDDPVVTGVLIAAVLYAAFLMVPVIFAFPYKHFIMKDKATRQIDGRRSLHLLTEDGDFVVSKWSCFDDMDTLCYTVWMLPLRAMDTYVSSGVALASSWYLVLLFWIIPIAFPLWLAGKRQALRRTLGSTRQKKRFVVGDVCFTCWCPWCAVTQEAQTLDAAMETRTACCFTLDSCDSFPVGVPLLLDSGKSRSPRLPDRLNVMKRPNPVAGSVPEAT